ncbi:MAG: N-acetyl-gamma-glutamyl-phosphate reductase [Treponema sp.]|jgi:N-acetyl-gamma-glutamyl-phosphate reductase|nr:N-acetyl-gamma-glutamyl-phosphate reductase [Treponema sp.]
MIAGIIGATGYAGAELVRILAGHPQVDGLLAASAHHAGERLEDLYLNFQGRVSAVLEHPDNLIAAADVVFAALPHGTGEDYARSCMAKGVHCIDLSADYRFDGDEAVFRAWYGKGYQYPGLRRRSVYGLPELNRQRIQAMAAEGPVIIGNPGCYPTSASLGAYPALARGFAGEGPIIVDAASGITGGGREPVRAFHYPECADSLAPYKVGAHRHTPEIARNFQAMAGRPAPLIFTPHLAPMNRGILSTIYIPLAAEYRTGGWSRVSAPPDKDIEAAAAEFQKRYQEFYQNEPFVRVLPPGAAAATGRVRHSNYCDLSIHLDLQGCALIVISAIDNMVKGAAGQAVQNMNILLGFPEDAGLQAVPALF